MTEAEAALNYYVLFLSVFIKKKNVSLLGAERKLNIIRQGM